MRPQNRQHRRGGPARRGNQSQRDRRNIPENRRGDRNDQVDRPRGSKNFGRRPERGNRHGDRQGQSDRVRRPIGRRDRDPNSRRKIARSEKGGKNEPTKDLDGQLMNYWIKAGKKQDQDGTNIAQVKLNEDLDNYWQKKDQNAQKVEQKKQ